MPHDDLPKEDGSGIELKRYSRDSRQIYNGNTSHATNVKGTKAKEFVENNRQVIEKGSIFQKPSLRYQEF